MTTSGIGGSGRCEAVRGKTSAQSSTPKRSSHRPHESPHPSRRARRRCDGVQPAGTYTVETIETTLDDLSFIAYRRVSTSIVLPAVGVVARQRQVIFIDPVDLEAAVKRDAPI
jgi:hypothetical protein